MNVRFVLTLPGFFSIAFEKLAVEVGPRTGLTYFLHRGRVVAIAEPSRDR